MDIIVTQKIATHNGWTIRISRTIDGHWTMMRNASHHPMIRALSQQLVQLGTMMVWHNELGGNKAPVVIVDEDAIEMVIEQTCAIPPSR